MIIAATECHSHCEPPPHPSARRGQPLVFPVSAEGSWRAAAHNGKRGTSRCRPLWCAVALPVKIQLALSALWPPTFRPCRTRSIIATLVGGSLLGILGALVAIPVAATIHLLLEEVAFRRLDQS
ncbi:MAG: hypothetical protein QOJ19_1819 [Acidimicrobiia bacterium]|nr:hypothetical protein [Acidimicrobiia bacterium]